MLTHFARSEQGADYPEGVKFGLNYGLENVRLIAPVPVGGRIRNHVRLVDISEKGEGRLLIKTENTIEVEGGEKPAMVATWLSLLFLDDRAAT